MTHDFRPKILSRKKQTRNTEEFAYERNIQFKYPLDDVTRQPQSIFNEVQLIAFLETSHLCAPTR